MYLQTLISLNLKHPFGVAVHEDRVYWTDSVTNSIESVNKLDGSDRHILRTNIRDLMDIHVFHRRRPQGIIRSVVESVLLAVQ